MANTATNIINVNFKNENDINPFLKEFEKNLYICNDPEPEEGYTNLMIEFESKWSEPEELLKKLVTKYNCTIIGVCYEFGCNYINSFKYE